MNDTYTNLEDQLIERTIALKGLNINSCRSRPKFGESGCQIYSRYFMFLSSPKEGAIVDLIENWDMDGFEPPNVSKEFPPLKVNVQRGPGGQISMVDYSITLEGKLI
tara:strand:- start:55981 stop:56301 length:321 start_codon:yes stop_codon:yes gene_type:complete